MIDTHCHVDLYPQPTEVLSDAAHAGVTTIIVTNLPSAFDRAYPFVQTMRHTRLALGLHPLVAEQHETERGRFTELINKTSYVGEIGLDFSRAGYSTKELQIESLRFVLRTLKGKPKFITLHSRQAEATALDILEEAGRTSVVFHWYTGSVRLLSRAVSNGHFFSVNPAMINSAKGRKIIEALPPDRILTESDGPFIKIGKRTVFPWDVSIVEDYLATFWHMPRPEVSTLLKANFFRLLHPIRVIQKS